MYLKSIEKEQEDKLFMRWVNGYQFKISFDEFKSELLKGKEPESGKSGKEQSELDIYMKVSDILRKGK